MSRQDHISAQCAGKSSFPSRAIAKEIARKARRKGVKVNEYRCDHCGRWHIGDPTYAKHDLWEPRKEQDRPTPQRRQFGEWEIQRTERNGPKVARDMASTPIDEMAYTGVISQEQAQAGRDFEELYRAARETVTTRDSCTIWEPRGEDSSDGPVEAAERRRELRKELGGYYEAILRYTCVEHIPPRGPVQIGILREALNVAERFFKR